MEAGQGVPELIAGQVADHAMEVAQDIAGFEGVLWNGLFAPAGTPRAIIAKLQAEAHVAVHRPELRERLTGLGIDPVANTPEQFIELLRAESARFATVVKAAKIKAE